MHLYAHCIIWFFFLDCLYRRCQINRTVLNDLWCIDLPTTCHMPVNNISNRIFVEEKSLFQFYFKTLLKLKHIMSLCNLNYIFLTLLPFCTTAVKKIYFCELSFCAKSFYQLEKVLLLEIENFEIFLFVRFSRKQFQDIQFLKF